MYKVIHKMLLIITFGEKCYFFCTFFVSECGNMIARDFMMNDVLITRCGDSFLSNAIISIGHLREQVTPRGRGVSLSTSVKGLYDVFTRFAFLL